MIGIVKVQIPLVTNDPVECALVYAKGRKNIVQQPLGGTTKKLMGDDKKAFFEAKFRQGKWTIGKRVTDQAW